MVVMMSDAFNQLEPKKPFYHVRSTFYVLWMKLLCNSNVFTWGFSNFNSELYVNILVRCYN